MPSVSRRAATIAVATLLASTAAGTAAGTLSLAGAFQPTSTSVTISAAARSTAVVPTPAVTRAPQQRPAGAPAAVTRTGTAVAPPPGASAQAAPQPRAAVSAAVADGYAFLFPENANGPVRWNPCQPVHYVTNIAAAPRLRADVVSAVAKLSAATGIVFLYDGDTTEHSSSHRPVVEQIAGVTTWAPVLVDVAAPGQSDLLRDGDDGEGVATWWRTSAAGTQIVTGQLVLRAGSVPTRLGGFGDPDAAGPFLLHELGHVLGLGHVSAAGEIMNHDGALRSRGLGAGDLAGLRLLGATQGCLPTMPVPSLDAGSVPLRIVH